MLSGLRDDARMFKCQHRVCILVLMLSACAGAADARRHRHSIGAADGGATGKTIQQHVASALAFKDSKRWDDSIWEFRTVLTMKSAADAATWAEATHGLNALCHGQPICFPPDFCLTV